MNPVQAALADPCRALAELDKLDAEDSLKAYVDLTWPELEPGTNLVNGWAVDAIVDALEAVGEGEVRQLLVNVPPGFMKSMLTSVFFPTWLWGPKNRPHLRIISTSYAQSLAVRDNRRARDLILSETYQRHWGDRFKLAGDQNEKIRYENSAKGFRQAASTGSALIGHRGDIIIVDDPHSPQSAESDVEREEALMWFGETLPTRFNDVKKGVMIVIMQRLHERDVSGFILANELGFEHLRIPMEFDPKLVVDGSSLAFRDPRTERGELAWPERFPREEVEALKKTFRAAGGEYAVSGQLQQDPVPREGGMFQRSDFHVTDEEPPERLRLCRGWDLAATKDGHGARTAGVKLGLARDGTLWILDAVFGRWGPAEARANMDAAMDLDGMRVCQSIPKDPGQAGKAQVHDMASKWVGRNLHFSPESGAKADRARPLSVAAENGLVRVVRASWNEVLIDEFCSFPAGATADMVDAGSRALAWLVANPEPEVGGAPEVF